MALVWLIPAFSAALIIVAVAMRFGLVPARSLVMVSVLGALLIAVVIGSAFVLPAFAAVGL